ncbi:DUF4248 domain-containing protein [Phocaeicola vulgatus]|nr:DUF4248 domain-containing protein [Phocaeicola vulgatus]
MNQEEKAFIIRAYDKAELAELYSPGRTAAAALQTLYRWMRRNMLLQEELNEAGYNKFRHSFLKHEVAIIVRHRENLRTYASQRTCCLHRKTLLFF